MAIRVEEYVRADGTIPYRLWFDSLDAQAAAKIVTAKLRMELGNTSRIKWFAGIGEYVIDWGPGYRIYLAKDGDSAAPSAISKPISNGLKRCMRNIRLAKRQLRCARETINARGNDYGFDT